MSDLKPPSQNRPGSPPSRRRTAMGRAASPIPIVSVFRQESFMSRRLSRTFAQPQVRPAANPPPAPAARPSLPQYDLKGKRLVPANAAATLVRPPRQKPRTLAGATILQIVPALGEEPLAHAAVDTALTLLQAGARAIIAADGGALAGELR